ncbi:hypothetical protein LENED_006332 [Lentinula edodes]|uniref:Uncharacterized protein n=1 Tax=Lentinula edodes TaxID=5353 RepID=A0A1Q3EBQ7_LENED|nr:hypothetical protein LENED_006332 [Lentinula edodes]
MTYHRKYSTQLDMSNPPYLDLRICSVHSDNGSGIVHDLRLSLGKRRILDELYVFVTINAHFRNISNFLVWPKPRITTACKLNCFNNCASNLKVAIY